MAWAWRLLCNANQSRENGDKANEILIQTTVLLWAHPEL